MPPPTEHTILTRTLLTPSSLPTILPIEKFTLLFPSSQRQNPRIKQLYRSLQHQRALDLDLVRENIDLEVARGEQQLREVVRSRAQDTKSGTVAGAGGIGGDHQEGREMLGLAVDEDIGNDSQVGGRTGSAKAPKTHTAATIVPALEAAVRDLEAELGAMEEEREALEREMEGIVSGLSDLVYTRPRKGEGEEVLEVLRELDAELGKSDGRRKGREG